MRKFCFVRKIHFQKRFLKNVCSKKEFKTEGIDEIYKKISRRMYIKP